jgi:hypothetical protein
MNFVFLFCFILIVFSLGGIGGFIAFLISRKGKSKKLSLNEIKSFTCFFDVLLGGVAAIVIWCMYGPLAQLNIMSLHNVTFCVSLSQLVSSVLVGMGGANILESQLTIYKLNLSRNKENEDN